MVRLTQILCFTLLVLVSNSISLVAASDSQVLVLTDDTFERATQALNPTSSRRWFVKFYAPWCNFCKRLVPTWEELAKLMHDNDKVMIAALDATSNPLSKQRFRITGYPTLVLFAEGKQYTYDGDLSLEDLQEYCTRTYKDETPQEVPPDNSFGSIQWNRFWGATKQNKYMRFLVSSVLVFNGVVIVGLIVFCVRNCLYPQDDKFLQEKSKLD